jgi:uncharacterized protein YbjT (DUF2867 family)
VSSAGLVVAIAGGNGKVARRLERLLVARGDSVRALIRSPERAPEIEADGVETVVCDLETASVDDVAGAIAHTDAVVFAAGAGPGSGVERKLRIDRDGAIKLLEAAKKADIDRYLMISSIGAEDPPGGDDSWSVYLQAKAAADRALMESDLEWTIVRPVFLSSEPGGGRVRIDSDPLDGQVSRDDVAAVLAALLHEPRSVHKLLYVASGDEPIDEALDAFLAV